MKKLLGIAAVLLAMTLPVFAQGRRLSSDDQQRFDSYFSRWQEYRRTNNRDEIISMQKRMQDVYHHYGIPADTPFARIATGGDYRWGNDRERDRDHDHDNWRDDHDRENRWQGRLNSDDQRRFDSYYSRWLEYRRTNNRDEIVSMERRMRDVYRHNGIPGNTPFEAVASNARRY